MAFHYFWQGPFSNFYTAPFTDPKTGLRFFCSEQCFMWYKAITFGDIETSKRILVASDPLQCKHLGREVKPYDEAKWVALREEIMEYAVTLKFQQNADLKVLLKSIPDDFVEASPFDAIWGIKMDEKTARKVDPSKWRGLNLLGKITTRVRDKI